MPPSERREAAPAYARNAGGARMASAREPAEKRWLAECCSRAPKPANKPRYPLQWPLGWPCSTESNGSLQNCDGISTGPLRRMRR